MLTFSKEERRQLVELLEKLKEVRESEVIEENGYTREEFDNLTSEEVYELDDGDNLLEYVDGILSVMDF